MSLSISFENVYYILCSKQISKQDIIKMLKLNLLEQNILITFSQLTKRKQLNFQSNKQSGRSKNIKIRRKLFQTPSQNGLFMFLGHDRQRRH